MFPRIRLYGLAEKGKPSSRGRSLVRQRKKSARSSSRSKIPICSPSALGLAPKMPPRATKTLTRPSTAGSPLREHRSSSKKKGMSDPPPSSTRRRSASRSHSPLVQDRTTSRNISPSSPLVQRSTSRHAPSSPEERRSISKRASRFTSTRRWSTSRSASAANDLS